MSTSKVSLSADSNLLSVLTDLALLSTAAGVTCILCQKCLLLYLFAGHGHHVVIGKERLHQLQLHEQQRSSQIICLSVM